MIVKIEGKCHSCDEPATHIAFDRRNEKEPKLYCDHHAGSAEDSGEPEYVVECPNCECRFGVN